MRTGRGIGRDILTGAVAGAVAAWVMNQATTWMQEHEGPEARRREEAARGDRTAYEIAAEKAASLAGADLSEARRRQAGTALHWATGIGAGVAYALLRRRAPAVTAAKGLAYGTGFYVVVDELLNPLLGLTPGPQAFPWQTHGRGLGGHLVYGATLEIVLDGLSERRVS